MAITQVTTVTIDGVVIGLSDEIGTLIQNGDFTPENLAPYMFCGNNTVGTTRYGSLTGAMKTYSGSTASQGLWFPVVCTTRYGNETVEYALNDDIALENQCYGRNILVYGDTPTSEIHSGQTTSTQRIVTSVDFQKLYYDVELSADSISSTRPEAVTKTFYKSGTGGKVKTITNSVDTTIYVYDIFVDDILDEWYCILDYHFPGSDTANHQWKMCPTQRIQGNYGAITSNLYDGWSSFALTRAQWRWGPNSAYTVYGGENQSWAEGQNFDAFVDLGGDTVSYCDYDPYRAYCTCYVCGLDNALKQVANAGLKFKYNNTWYKPLGQGGVITGYTDDLTERSDWDEITNVTGNTVPVTPPAPPVPEDDPSDDQESGGIYGGASGMCNLYYMTSSEIKNLQDWFRGTVFSPGIQIPANFDPSGQLIGLMAFPIELGGSLIDSTITFRTSDNAAVNTGVSCQKAYGDDLKFDMGTINIPARMQERGVPFLDYSSQIEVYIPFCDVVQLDVQQVIGTTLKCEMWISPATGDVSAMLSSGSHPVAYTSGNCAQQLPISVSSYGAIAGAKLAAENRTTQAVFAAAQSVIKDVTNAGAIAGAIGSRSAINSQGMVDFSQATKIQGNMGLAGAAGVKAAGTVVNTALGLTAQNFDNKYALQVAKNSAPTHVSGSFGSCTSWHFPNYCYVKITRPHFQKPNNYGHTEAVPVVATKPLSSLTGLTTCVNPDVSGIGTATMQELETIKSYLMSGVIL